MEEQRTLNRRDFLRVAMGATVAAGAAATLGAQGVGAAGLYRKNLVPKGKIGIQLYTVRDQMSQDVDRTITAIVNIGYKEVEFAGLFGKSPEEMRALIDGVGLRAPSSHVGVNQMNGNPEGVFGGAVTLGQHWVVHPYFRSDNLDDYRRLAEDLNEAGVAARQYGLRVGYHNHAHEFEMMEGTFPYAVLLEETDPHLVDMELDLYWAIEGFYTYDNPEAKPLELFERAPRRFPLFHVKDGFPSRPGVEFADVGEGEIDFEPTFASKDSGVKHYFVENDAAPNDPNGSLDSAEDSYNNLVAEYSAGRV